MAVEDVEEETEPTPEEIRRRLKAMTRERPDVIFSIVECLMEYLGIPPEEQYKILEESANRWMQNGSS